MFLDEIKLGILDKKSEKSKKKENKIKLTKRLFERKSNREQVELS